MMKKLGARLLSAVMALSMLCGLLPAGALAADEQLDDGTYIVTANLYVPGEYNSILGKNAYLTNADVPPLQQVYNNAKLSVVDGEMTLALDIPNSVFTLQSISDGDNVKIVEANRDDVTYSDQSGTIPVRVELRTSRLNCWTKAVFIISRIAKSFRPCWVWNGLYR